MHLARKPRNNLKSINSIFTSDFHEPSNPAHICRGEAVWKIEHGEPEFKINSHILSISFLL